MLAKDGPAAPLLAACQDVLLRFEKAKRDYMPRPMGQDELILVLRDSIAKAKGGAA